jgi:hypothetical protein
MSQSAVGPLIGDGRLKFRGSFVAGKNVVVLTGIFNTSIAPFSVPAATVKYKSLSDFDGTYYDIELSVPPCYLGKTSVDLKFVKGSTTLHLTGQLATELPDRQTCTGIGQFILVPTP